MKMWNNKTSQTLPRRKENGTAMSQGSWVVLHLVNLKMWNLHSAYSSGEICSLHEEIYMRIFLAALCVRAKAGKQVTCSVTKSWM
jgi:hypothetical protein